MLSRLRSSPRLQFLALAASTAAFAGCAGLLAFLTDVTDPMDATFRMETGSDFGINIHTKDYKENALIAKGGKAAFDPYISNDGTSSAYVFLEVTLPDETFHLSDFNDKWELVSSEDDTAVYAYGKNGDLIPLSESTDMVNGENNLSITAPLCSNISLDKETPLMDDTYHIRVIGYAVQTEGLDHLTPQQAWTQIKGEQ